MFSTARLESVARVRGYDEPQINADRHSYHRVQKTILAVNRRQVAAMESVAGRRGTTTTKCGPRSWQRTEPLFVNGRFIGGFDC
jgi:hypothetical protein